MKIQTLQISLTSNLESPNAQMFERLAQPKRRCEELERASAGGGHELLSKSVARGKDMDSGYDFRP